MTTTDLVESIAQHRSAIAAVLEVVAELEPIARKAGHEFLLVPSLVEAIRKEFGPFSETEVLWITQRAAEVVNRNELSEDAGK